jgi:protein-disulfide isomerase
MKYFQKLCVGALLMLCVFIQGQGTAEAAAQNYATLTPAERTELLNVLVKQVQLLQKMLRDIQAKEAASNDEDTPTVSPVTTSDYTTGPANAKKQIVTFTDFDCPFCHSFHTTLTTLLAERSDISVTYRHFPLEQLHPNATKLAVAAECAGRLGGDSAFWDFINSMFASRDVNETTDITKLNSFVAMAGISPTVFAQCQAGTAALDAVEADMADGQRGGVRGTPASFVFVDGEVVGEINGAQPLSVVETMLEKL